MDKQDVIKKIIKEISFVTAVKEEKIETSEPIKNYADFFENQEILTEIGDIFEVNPVDIENKNTIEEIANFIIEREKY